MTTQELEQQVKELTDLVTSLETQIKALNNDATIPFDVGKAFKVRILSDTGVASLSTKLSTSEDSSVLTAVSPNTYTEVLKTPDGFLQITLLSNIYYIPYYT